MTKEQRTYVVQQIRAHAQWLIDNAVLVHPIQPSESDVAYALGDAGFTLLERPIYQVTLPANETHVANKVVVDAYSAAVNALLSTYTTDILNSSTDNPATVLNRFIADASQIQLGA